MPIRLELDYWSHSQGVQAPANIKPCRQSKTGLSFTPSDEGEGKSYDVRIDVDIDSEEERAFKALLTVLDPESDSPTMSAIEQLIEVAFLAGIEFSQKAETT
ncbi:MAG: hypothetical protein JWN90_380 [Parcubacteria group bacterium]|nr:hypothetical protein [Parcubacteria group bacterium]